MSHARAGHPPSPQHSAWPVLRYGYPFPFQIAPRKAAAFVSLRIRNGVLSPVAGDLKIGVDVFLFDKISNLGRPQGDRDHAKSRAGESALNPPWPTGCDGETHRPLWVRTPGCEAA